MILLASKDISLIKYNLHVVLIKTKLIDFKSFKNVKWGKCWYKINYGELRRLIINLYLVIILKFKQ